MGLFEPLCEVQGIQSFIVFGLKRPYVGEKAEISFLAVVHVDLQQPSQF
jgi:hypothetical protein